MADQPKRVPWEGRPVRGKIGNVVILEPERAPTATDRDALVRALAMILVKAALVTPPEQNTEQK